MSYNQTQNILTQLACSYDSKVKEWRNNIISKLRLMVRIYSFDMIIDNSDSQTQLHTMKSRIRVQMKIVLLLKVLI